MHLSNIFLLNKKQIKEFNTPNSQGSIYGTDVCKFLEKEIPLSDEIFKRSV